MSSNSLPPADPTSEADSRLGENIMHFGRVLRAAGLPVGPGKTLDAIEAIRTVGLASRLDFYWALHAVYVNRRDQRPLFDQAFHIFWRNPKLLERMISMLLPTFIGDQPQQEEDAVMRRIAEALSHPDNKGQSDAGIEADEDTRIDLDARLTYSSRETLAEKDFEKMSIEEFSSAKSMLRRFSLPVKPLKTRRFERNPSASDIDMPASVRASVRRGGDMILLRHKRHKLKPPPIVALCDISGSMEHYARIMLHFLHALSNHQSRVHSFLFGTKLTNISRSLKYRDPDEALAHVGKSVTDWTGGTRIGASLHTFNRDWSRRVLGQGATVLLITDGLDREGAEGISTEMERLHKSCRQLIWLNPLLRFNRYEPKSMGAKAMMTHVDLFKPVHNLVSLAQLAEVLGNDKYISPQDMRRWREMAQ